MFRLEAELELLSAPTAPSNSAPPISLRGYKTEVPVAVTGEFIAAKPLSIGDIVGFCPIHRDLYFKKSKLHRELNSGDGKSWARTAGPLIQDFLEFVYTELNGKKNAASVGKNPEEFRREAADLLSKFCKRAKNIDRFNALDQKVKGRFDLKRSDIECLLVNSAVLDLYHLQGALNYPRQGSDPPRESLKALQIKGSYSPADHIKISADSTPDILLPKFKAIGDMKSGTFHEEHFLTVAGYALGYESATNRDIDLGVLYLVETATDCIRSSRSIVFWISDSLRRSFLDRRDRALARLTPPTDPGPLTSADDKKLYCDRCTYKTACVPLANAPAA